MLLAFGAGSLWTLEEGTGEVSRINPKTRTAKILTEGANASSIAYGHGAVWLGGRIGVTRLDPDTRKTTTLPIDGLQSATSTSIAIGPDAVWFAASTKPCCTASTRGRPQTRPTRRERPERGCSQQPRRLGRNSLDGTVSAPTREQAPSRPSPSAPRRAASSRPTVASGPVRTSRSTNGKPAGSAGQIDPSARFRSATPISPAEARASRRTGRFPVSSATRLRRQHRVSSARRNAADPVD